MRGILRRLTRLVDALWQPSRTAPAPSRPPIAPRFEVALRRAIRNLENPLRNSH